jgi:hypothetical protein
MSLLDSNDMPDPNPKPLPPPAAPHHVSYAADVPFWKPGPIDSLKHLGWRWVLFLPAVAVVALMAVVPFFGLAGILFWGGGKLLILSIGLAVSTAGGAIKSAMNQRTDPFCIHCGYDLIGLPDRHTCPECGRPFSLELIEEYRRDPGWFIQRHRQGRHLADRDVPFHAGTSRRKKTKDGT